MIIDLTQTYTARFPKDADGQALQHADIAAHVDLEGAMGERVDEIFETGIELGLYVASHPHQQLFSFTFHWAVFYVFAKTADDAMAIAAAGYDDLVKMDPGFLDDACPGCGCEPGDGITETCNNPDGCGFSKSERDRC